MTESHSLVTESLQPFPTVSSRTMQVQRDERIRNSSRLLETCPDPILSQILTYGGPTTISLLAATGRRLRDRTSEDVHWKALSVEYGKFSPHDETNDCSSWREFYETTPLVPVDVPSLGQAICSGVQGKPPMKRVLVQPREYKVEGTLEIPRHAQITIQCVQSPSCGRATLRLSDTSENVNQPLVRVQSGASLTLEGIDLQHSSAGNDYWNGNAAIVCGATRSASLLRNGRELKALLASADQEYDETTNLCLRHSKVTSQTGRGIMAVGEDVTVNLHGSSVEVCAATGIFVRYATVTLSDGCCMAQNGQGSSEIFPGQSSLFNDRGILRITKDCKISGSVKSLDGRMNFISIVPVE